ncbi:MAG: fibronectin type III domain-containing protein, partial [Acidimicrobiales bacterium]
FCAQILLSTSQPEQTVLISSQTALANLSATWLLPDPPSYAGVFEFKFPATSLGTELGGCCALLGLPTPPSNVTISRTGSAMTVTWDPGAQSTQSAPITGYVADAYRPTGTQINAGTCTSISTTCTIQGLTPGFDYNVQVRAVNSSGASDPANYSVPIYNGNAYFQGNGNLNGAPERDDQFGSFLSKGDFNNDGYYDLVISAPSEGTTNAASEGIAHVIFQFPSLASNQVLTRSHSTSETGINAGFGTSSASGDFNGDGFDDLAIGVPNENVNGHDNAGKIQIFHGSADGFPNIQVIHQDTNWIAGIAHADDRFGSALAVGDMDADGYDDLVVGVPGEYYYPNDRFCNKKGPDACGSVGAINVLYGAPGGLSGWDDHYFGQNTSRVAGIAHVGDQFGAAVAVGDINGDGYDDVVIGSPDEYYRPNYRYCVRYSCGQVGAINVLYGSSDGVTTANDHYFAQNSSGIIGRSEVGDRFGAALAIGDIDGDGYEDVVIGAPDDNFNYYCRSRISSICGNVGSVNILYGAENGLSRLRDQFFNQNSSGLNELAQDGDKFGAALALGDLNDDSYLDLIIGVPGETISGNNNAGAAHILYGTADGISSSGSQLLHVNQDAFTGNAETNAGFGSALLIVDGEILIGAPGATVSGATGAGAIYYLN